MTASVDHPAIVEAYAELCAWLRSLSEPQADDAADELERLQSELNTALERVKVLEEGMTKLITTSQMLLQNAEGCAVNHYGNDFQEFGPPGWLVDCENDIVSARALLQGDKK